MELLSFNHLICKKKIFNIYILFRKKIIMNEPEYSFLIPAVKDFPDEPIKKQRSNIKKEDPKERDD